MYASPMKPKILLNIVHNTTSDALLKVIILRKIKQLHECSHFCVRDPNSKRIVWILFSQRFS